MSSKILRGDETDPVRPIMWDMVGGSVPKSSAPRKPAPNPSQADEAEIERLKGRVAELEQALEHRVREAQQAGYREGEAAGRKQAEAAVHPVLEQMARSIKALADLRGQLRTTAESDMVRLAIAIARRILHRELSVDPNAILGLVKAAFERLKLEEISRVRVHPDHQAILRGWLDRAGTTASIEIIPDPTRALGDAVFETNRGNLDASLASQMSEIERGLIDRFQGQQ